MRSGRLLSGGGTHTALSLSLSLFLRSSEAANICVDAETALVLEHGGSGLKNESPVWSIHWRTYEASTMFI
jgi:hypothetical protein